MSRLAKLKQPKILTKLSPKPSTKGFYYDLDEMIEHSSLETLRKDYQSGRQSGMTTATGSKKSEESERYGSKIQVGMIKRVQELFLSLKAEEAKKSLFKRLIYPEDQPSKKKEDHIFYSFSCQNQNLGKITSSRHIGLPKRKQEESLSALRSPDSELFQPGNLIKRFFLFCDLEEEVFILSVIYLEKAIENNKRIGREHFQKLFVGCFLLAHKFLNEDFFWAFEDLGLLSGVSRHQIGQIESVVLDKIFDHRLVVSTGEFEKAKRRMTEVFF